MSNKSVISSIADINPPLPRFVYDHELVSFLGMADISDSGRIISRHEREYSKVKQGFTKFAENDVIFAKITPCMENGKGAIANGLKNGIGCGSTEFHILRAKENGIPDYIFQVSVWNVLRQKAEMSMTGSAGQQRVPASFFDEYEVYIPKVNKQRKIARILTTIDKVIEQTENTIDKLKKIKQGMMHDLFTRGIDVKTGKLRPSQSEAPELYKQSKLGWIPRDWETGELADVCDVGSSKRIYFNEYCDSGVPFYRSKEIILKSKNIFLEPEIYISREKFEEIKDRYGAPQVGDILITSVGTLGITYQVTEDEEFYFKDGNLIWLRKIKGINLSNYLDYFLGMFIIRQLDYLTIGTSQNAFTIDKLRRMKVMLINGKELIKISNIMKKLQNFIHLEVKRFNKIFSIKKGVMQDLLTGKVEVSIKGGSRLS